MSMAWRMDVLGLQGRSLDDSGSTRFEGIMNGQRRPGSGCSQEAGSSNDDTDDLGWMALLEECPSGFDGGLVPLGRIRRGAFEEALDDLRNFRADIFFGYTDSLKKARKRVSRGCSSEHLFSALVFDLNEVVVFKESFARERRCKAETSVTGLELGDDRDRFACERFGVLLLFIGGNLAQGVDESLGKKGEECTCKGVLLLELCTIHTQPGLKDLLPASRGERADSELGPFLCPQFLQPSVYLGHRSSLRESMEACS